MTGPMTVPMRRWSGCCRATTSTSWRTARAAISLDPEGRAATHMPRGWLLATPVVLDGRLAGRWQRSVRPDRVDVEVTLFTPPAPAAAAALEAEAHRFAAFLELPLRLRVREAG